MAVEMVGNKPETGGKETPMDSQEVAATSREVSKIRHYRLTGGD
jgi:hypothetical protein